MKPVVLVLFRTRERDKEILESILSDTSRVTYFRDISTDKLSRILQDVVVLMTGSGRDITVQLISKMPKLQFIQTLSAGLDYVPFDIIPDNVIVASNAGGNARAVAEYALALILDALKKISMRDRYMRCGIWLRKTPCRLLKDKIVGILGLGNVGSHLAIMLKALGAKVYAINRRGKTNLDVDFIGTLKQLEFILRESDIVVISLPLTVRTRNLIGKKELELMKKNVILINVSRGEIIDEKALFEFLSKNPDAFAALDVWWKYPLDLKEKTYQDYPFHELDNVIMSPHVAGFAEEIRENVIRNAAENAARFLRGEQPFNIADKREYIGIKRSGTQHRS